MLGRRHHLVQHAVDAVPHLELVLERLEVDVRRLRLDRGPEDEVQQPHHRGGVDHLVDVVGLALLLVRLLELEVVAGQRFKIELHNAGSTPVEFESRRLRQEKVMGPGVHSFVVVHPLKPGRYDYFDEFHLPDAQGVIIEGDEGSSGEPAFAARRAVWARQGLGGLKADWLARTYGLGQMATVRYGATPVTGRFDGIDDDGTLLLAQEDGTVRRLAAGEVVFAKPPVTGGV